jgi:hypothetical protein
LMAQVGKVGLQIPGVFITQLAGDLEGQQGGC